MDPQRRLPSAPNEPLGRSGTYMVWRKLRQDVALFRRTLRDAAEHYADGDHEKLAAKVVGRWRNGAPLVSWPDQAPDADAFDPKDPSVNAFSYAQADPHGYSCPVGSHIRRSNPRDGLGFDTHLTFRGNELLFSALLEPLGIAEAPDFAAGIDADLAGLRCPLGAHTRRSNPRDALGFDGKLTFRHRIIRRGMPYGRPLPAGELEDDGEQRGLVFVCFNASISRQFEGIQAQWLNDGNALHLGHDSDFLLGHPLGTGKMTIRGERPFLLGPQGPFVTTRGGAYLFVPGMRALAALAGSDAQR